ncbi:MAG: mechanosensitive ion channel family protein [Arachnia sp.]
MSDTDILMTVLLFAGLGLLAGLLISGTLTLIVRALKPRVPILRAASTHLKTPQRVFFTLAGLTIGVAVGTSSAFVGTDLAWRDTVLHILTVLMILAGGYGGTGTVWLLQEAIMEHQERMAASPAQVLRVRTQMQLITRIAIALVWIIAVGGALMTFGSFRAVGASIFASAGLLSIVAGIAAQSSLSNLFAGLQIAFSDAIRVDDIVEIDGYRATIEEINLTFVILRVWDGRRVLVPSTRFMNQSFENWTRHGTEHTGSVFFDVDWRTPVDELRAEVERVVTASQLWDQRSVGVVVTEAIGGNITVRATMTAANSDDSWDLRCLVREQVVAWLRSHAPEGLPRTRFEAEPPGPDVSATA